MTYGGDEEIVLKGGAKKRSGKDGEVVEQNVYAQRSSGLIFGADFLRKQNGNMQQPLMQVKESIILLRGKEIPSQLYSFWRQSKGINSHFKQGNGDYGGIAGWR
jgi:hypothetical protein